jgi:hypothetical protein
LARLGCCASRRCYQIEASQMGSVGVAGLTGAGCVKRPGAFEENPILYQRHRAVLCMSNESCAEAVMDPAVSPWDGSRRDGCDVAGRERGAVDPAYPARGALASRATITSTSAPASGSQTSLGERQD